MDDTTDRLDLDAIRDMWDAPIRGPYPREVLENARTNIRTLLAEVARLRAERDMWADAFERLVKRITDHLAEHSPDIYKEIAPIVRVVLAEVDGQSRVVLAEQAEK